MQHHFNIFGRRCRDQITGFEGVVTSICFDLYGCVQAILTPPVDKDGKTAEGYWFDVKRLTILDPSPTMPVPTFAPGEEAGGAEKPLRGV